MFPIGTSWPSPRSRFVASHPKRPDRTETESSRLLRRSSQTHSPDPRYEKKPASCSGGFRLLGRLPTATLHFIYVLLGAGKTWLARAGTNGPCCRVHRRRQYCSERRTDHRGRAVPREVAARAPARDPEARRVGRVRARRQSSRRPHVGAFGLRGRRCRPPPSYARHTCGRVPATVHERNATKPEDPRGAAASSATSATGTFDGVCPLIVPPSPARASVSSHLRGDRSGVSLLTVDHVSPQSAIVTDHELTTDRDDPGFRTPERLPSASRWMTGNVWS